MTADQVDYTAIWVSISEEGPTGMLMAHELNSLSGKESIEHYDVEAEAA